MMSALKQATELFARDRFDLATPYLREHLAKHPRDGLASAMLAMCLLQARKFYEAQDVARLATLQAPEVALGHYVLGVLLSERRDFPAAIAELKLAVKGDPTQPHFHAMLAFAYLNQNRTEDARAAAERGLDMHPQDPDCLNALASTLANEGKVQSAQQLIAHSVHLDPLSAATHAHRARLLLLQGHARRAEEGFREALRLEPGNEYARRGLFLAQAARRWYHRLPLLMVRPFMQFTSHYLAAVGAPPLLAAAVIAFLPAAWYRASGAVMAISLVPLACASWLKLHRRGRALLNVMAQGAAMKRQRRVCA